MRRSGPRPVRHALAVAAVLVLLIWVLPTAAKTYVGQAQHEVTRPEIGRIALSVDARGDHVLLIQVCNGRLDEIRVTRRAGDDSIVGIWWRPRPMESGVAELNFANPSAGWRGGDDPVSLSEPAGLLFITGAHSSGGRTNPISLDSEELQKIRPSDAVVDDGLIESRAAFEARRC